MNSNPFEQEFRNSLKAYAETHEDFWYTRLYDTKTFRYISENMWAIRQPADFMAVYNGKPYFFECKSSHSNSSYAFTYIKPHQLESLLRIKDAGGRAYFMINDRSKVRDFHTYALTPDIALYEFNRLLSSGKKSIKWEQLKTITHELPHSTGLWDLSGVFI
jgi:recombination protein U